jgi:hypothetical protein
MEAVQRYVTQTLPRYLKSLPIPKDVNGFSTLSHDEWMKLIPFFAVITTLIVVLLTSLFTDPSKKWYVTAYHPCSFPQLPAAERSRS